MKFSIPLFTGITPKIASHLLPNEGATLADNCRLESGEIRALPKATLVDKINQDGMAGLYRYVTLSDVVYMLPWSVEIDAHKGFLSKDQYNRVYYTDDGGAKAWCDDDVGPGIFSPYKLGVPAPTATPVANTNGLGTGEVVDTAYIFTLVSRHGEEGAPSPASDIIGRKDGDEVSLSGLTTPVLGGCNTIVAKRLYRLMTGTSGSTEYQFVDEFDVVDTTYVDIVDNVDLAEVVPSEDWLIPPDGLQGLIPLSGGFFAGFVGRDIWFTEPGYPHAMPLKYSLSVNYDIVGSGVSGNSLIVLTDAIAYIVDCTDIAYASPRGLDGSVPCESKAGIVSTKYGVLYPSTDGLYLVQAASSAPENVTKTVFSKENWKGFNPSSMRAFWYRNQYICFYTKDDGSQHGFILEVGSPPMVRTLGLFAVAGYLEKEGNTLYLAFKSDTITNIVEWGKGTFSYTSEWRSKEFRTPGPMNMAAAKVDADYKAILTEEEFELHQQELLDRYADLVASGEYGGDIGGSPVGEHVFGGDAIDSIHINFIETLQVVFQLYGDGKLIHTQNVQNGDPFVLPDNIEKERFITVVASDLPISGVHIATSMQELAE